jgi:hypothetical protein
MYWCMKRKRFSPSPLFLSTPISGCLNSKYESEMRDFKTLKSKTSNGKDNVWQLGAHNVKCPSGPYALNAWKIRLVTPSSRPSDFYFSNDYSIDHFICLPPHLHIVSINHLECRTSGDDMWVEYTCKKQLEVGVEGSTATTTSTTTKPKKDDKSTTVPDNREVLRFYSP